MSETIVVGVDGSEGAEAALRWALAEARIRDAEVHVVHAYEAPFYLGAMAEPTPMVVDTDVVGEGARAVLNEIVDAVVGDSDPGVTLERLIAEGPPATVLREAASDAAMLVVGSRGRGGFTELLLGSVSSQLVHHATGPVVVVPAHPEKPHS